MAGVKPQPFDERHVVAGELLGIPTEQVVVQYGLINDDMVYAWDQPRGSTVLVDSKLRAQKFGPGVLLAQALASFKRT